MLKQTLFYLLLAAMTWLAPAARCAAAGGIESVGGGKKEGARLVRIYTTRDEDRTQFWVENKEHCEITVTFEVRTLNLKSTVELPCTATFAANSTTLAFELEPEDLSRRWEFSYTNYYKLGSHLARHDDAWVYHLPYPAGRRYVVTQAYNGAYSHKGPNRYALDWKMPEGTPVCAVRDGVVVKLREDSNTGGPSVKYDRFSNFILVRHEDGTLAHYCHLQHNGALVKVGERVEAGEVIGRSGSTGFSTGPHLHLCIFRTIDGRERESIPVRFQTAEYGAVMLREDGRYRAVQMGAATLETGTRGEGSGGEAPGGGN